LGTGPHRAGQLSMFERHFIKLATLAEQASLAARPNRTGSDRAYNWGQQEVKTFYTTFSLTLATSAPSLILSFNIVILKFFV